VSGPLYDELAQSTVGDPLARSERPRAIRVAPPAPSRAARLSATSFSVAGDEHRTKRLFFVNTFVFEKVSASLPPPGSNALSLSPFTAALDASPGRAAFPGTSAGSAA
jgi:hypothetical protein